MSAADLLVHSAHQEPLGRVLLEAAASELPIVATNVGGTGEILQDSRDAILVPPASHAALAEAIATALDDPDGGERRAESARRRIEQKFGVQGAADALLESWHCELRDSSRGGQVF